MHSNCSSISKSKLVDESGMSHLCSVMLRFQGQRAETHGVSRDSLIASLCTIQLLHCQSCPNGVAASPSVNFVMAEQHMHAAVGAQFQSIAFAASPAAVSIEAARGGGGLQSPHADQSDRGEVAE